MRLRAAFNSDSNRNTRLVHAVVPLLIVVPVEMWAQQCDVPPIDPSLVAGGSRGFATLPVSDHTFYGDDVDCGGASWEPQRARL